jgi:hypothetical protein
MDMSHSDPHGIAHARQRPTRKAWTEHLRRTLGFPARHPLSVQLPAGEYTLSERDDIHYALYASHEFLLDLRVTELEHLRARGDLVIQGTWP